MKRISVITLAIVMAAMMSLPVNASRRGGRMGPDDDKGMGRNPLLHAPWERVEQIAKEINLTEKQMDQLKKLRTSLMDSRDGKRRSIRDQHDQLRQLLRDGDAGTKEEAHKLAKSIADQKYELAKTMIDAHYELVNILTDQQRDALKEHMRELRGKRDDDGRRHGRGSMDWSDDDGMDDSMDDSLDDNSSGR